MIDDLNVLEFSPYYDANVENINFNVLKFLNI